MFRHLTNKAAHGGVALLATVFFVAPISPAFGLWCSDECTTASDCWQECVPARAGYTITCAEHGVCKDGQPPVYDMVTWMKQTYSGATTTHLEQSSGGVISEFTACPSDGIFYRTNNPDGEYWERFSYTIRWIDIRREVFDASAGHYRRMFGPMHWLERYMSPSPQAAFTSDCTWWESYACSTTGQFSCANDVYLKGPYLIDVGGDIGTVEALARVQVLGNGDEEWYYYAKPYGMVLYEYFFADGSLKRRSVFDRIVSGEVEPNPMSCDAPC